MRRAILPLSLLTYAVALAWADDASWPLDDPTAY